LYAIAEAEGAAREVEDELFAFAKAVEQHPDLREALTDAALPADRKKAVIADLLGERAHSVTRRLVELVIEAGRARELGRIAEQLAIVAAERRQSQFAEVRTAVPLSDAQRKRIVEALSKATGRPIEVKVVVDASVVGGIVARIGDEVIDGSLSSRLRAAREQLGSV
jgi:F-type H+-transporting ATPase subunit delta